MARARFIRPEFFTDSVTGRLPPLARLLYAAAWTQADIRGVLEWDADQLRLAAFPYDAMTSEECDALMAVIVTHGRVRVLIHEGKTYGQIVKWLDHQTFTSGEKKNGPRFLRGLSDLSQTMVRPLSDIGQTPTLSPPLSPPLSPSPSPTPSPMVADEDDHLFGRDPDPPSRPDQTHPNLKSWMDWKLEIGKGRIGIKEDGSSEATWAAIFHRAGWDELTKAFLYVQGTIKDPRHKVWANQIQEVMS